MKKSNAEAAEERRRGLEGVLCFLCESSANSAFFNFYGAVDSELCDVSAFGFGVNRVERLAASHEEAVSLGAAEADV